MEELMSLSPEQREVLVKNASLLKKVMEDKDIETGSLEETAQSLFGGKQEQGKPDPLQQNKNVILRYRSYLE